MSVQRRKDNKGRVLKTGESQRKDGSYMYRYSDPGGMRRTVYAPDLKALREKEDEIENNIYNGIDYFDGNITIEKLLERNFNLKRSLSASTQANYRNIITVLKRTSFIKTPIKYVKVSDAKSYILELANGKKYSTVAFYKSFLRSSFEIACEEGIISKNPFDFSLREILRDTSEKRTALTQSQVQILLNFIHSNSCYSKWEDEIRILLGTGLRISEMYGLTMNDIDFEHMRIHVNHQLSYRPSKGRNSWIIHPPKTKAGNRFIPMSNEVYECFKRTLLQRPHPTVEPSINGYTNFVFLSKSKYHNVKYECLLLQALNVIEAAYTAQYPNGPILPHLTPHIFRHTFCTNSINSGMNIKTVQYIMGHSSINMTLSVYTHATQTSVFEDFYKKVDNNFVVLAQSNTG